MTVKGWSAVRLPVLAGLLGATACTSTPNAPDAYVIAEVLPGITAPLPTSARRTGGVGIDSEAAGFEGPGYRISFDYGRHGGLITIAGREPEEILVDGALFDFVGGATGEAGWPYAFGMHQRSSRTGSAGDPLALTISALCRSESVCEAMSEHLRRRLQLSQSRKRPTD